MTQDKETPGKGDLILRLRGVGKQFGAVTALEDIELDVHAGDVVALVGDNGAGKSTLVKVLAGVHQPTSGTIEYLGKQVSLDTPGTALEMGIATVFQDLALCENLDVVTNLFLGHEISPWRMDEVQMEVRAWTLLQDWRRAFLRYVSRSPRCPVANARRSPLRARCCWILTSSCWMSQRPLCRDCRNTPGPRI